MNAGKRFEENWKKSVPEYVYYHRLNDNASIFTNSNAKYSVHNPFDCMLFSDGALFCFELKSTGMGYFTFERSKEDEGKKMIHLWQIQGLDKASKYNGIYSGFLFNFRNDEIKTEATFYQSIDDFNRMINELNKNSFKVVDLLKYNPIKISSEKIRVNYRYDIEDLLGKIMLSDTISKINLEEVQG